MRDVSKLAADRDFVVMPRARNGKRPWRLAWQVLKRAGRNPGRVGLGVVFAGVSLAIAVNALSYQTARHPAPFFAKQARAPDSRLSADPAPLPPLRPLPAMSAALQPAVPQMPVAPLPPKAQLQRDAIADMIRGQDPSVTQTSSIVRPEPQKQVLKAQSALAKLGYGPLKPDGYMGPGTRQAIEKFEKDRRLPVKGELSSRTLKELASRSGIAVE